MLQLGEPWPMQQGSGWLLLEPEEFEEQAPAIALMLLSPAELAGWHQMQRTALARRKRQWLLGRWAAKRSCREWFLQLGKEAPGWQEIQVFNEENGRPRMRLPDGRPLPELSIAHSETAALAACSDRPLGVDLEWQEHLQSDPLAFSRLAFTEEEQDLLPSLESERWRPAALHLWCAKEAVAKLTGDGFQGRPKRFAARSLDEEAAEIHFDGQYYGVSFNRSHGYIGACAQELVKSCSVVGL